MCHVHAGAHVSLLTPGETNYSDCHPRKTTTYYILHVVSITTHTHDRRKSMEKGNKEKKIKERKEKRRKRNALSNYQSTSDFLPQQHPETNNNVTESCWDFLLQHPETK